MVKSQIFECLLRSISTLFVVESIILPFSNSSHITPTHEGNVLKNLIYIVCHVLSLEISNFVNIQYAYIFLSLILFYINIFFIIYPYPSLYFYFITFVLIYHLFKCYYSKSNKFMLMKYQETCFLSPHLPR